MNNSDVMEQRLVWQDHTCSPSRLCAITVASVGGIHRVQRALVILKGPAARGALTSLLSTVHLLGPSCLHYWLHSTWAMFYLISDKACFIKWVCFCGNKRGEQTEAMDCPLTPAREGALLLAETQRPARAWRALRGEEGGIAGPDRRPCLGGWR